MSNARELAKQAVGGAISKADVGLGNADNTADSDKPISTATATAIASTNSELTDNKTKDLLALDAKFTGYGNTKRVPNTERFVETNTPNLITDTVGDSVRFTDGLVAQAPTETITMPLAPFAPTSTDELLDDKVNGVTTQMNHSKGDIVVSGNELIADSAWTPYTNTVITTVANGLRVEVLNANATVWAYVSQTVPLIQGEKYTISFNKTEDYSSSYGGYIALDDEAEFSSGYLGVGVLGARTYTFTALSTRTATLKINIRVDSTANIGDYITIDSISVKAVDNIHQAITTTAVGDLLTDTTKFKVLDYVTRYDVIGYTKTGYKTFKGLATFDEDMTTDDIATSQGWSKLGNGLYDTGTEEITSLRVVQRLNAGGEHRVHNSFGRSTLNGSTMGGVDTAVTSTYGCFTGTLTNGTITSTVGGTDGKFYDKVYNESNGGILGYSVHCTNDLDLDVISSELLSEGGLERGVETIKYTNNQITKTANAVYHADNDVNFANSVNTNHFNDNTLDYDKVYVLGDNGKVFYDENWDSSKYIRFPYVDSTSYAPVSTSAKTAEFNTLFPNGTVLTLLFVKSSRSLLTQGKALSTDVIGNPSVYPSDWLAKLGSGKPVAFNPLLVGENGEGYTVVAALNRKLSKKNLDSSYSSTFFDGTSFTNATDPMSNGIGNADYIGLGSAQSSILASYTSMNKPLHKADSLPTEKVQSKVVASNSHSIYKGAMVTNAVTDKVAVGNGTNGLESKVLENTPIAIAIHVNSIANTITTGIIGITTVVWTDRTIADGYVNGTEIELGVVYLRIGDSFSGAMSTWNDVMWKKVGAYLSPKHSAVVLDTEVTPASKWFTSLAVADNNEYCLQVSGQEVIGTGDNGKFDTLTNGTTTDANAVTVKTANLVKRLGVFKK